MIKLYIYFFHNRYAAEKSVRYEVFATIWKDMNMSEIFCLRQTDRECREVGMTLTMMFILKIENGCKIVNTYIQMFRIRHLNCKFHCFIRKKKCHNSKE